MHLLKQYGVTDRFINEALMYTPLKLGRILAQYRGIYKVVTADGFFSAEVSGKLQFETKERAKYPAVGDFVMLDYQQKNDLAVIQHILTRKSVFLRSAVGVSGQAQVVAANMDVVFICMSLNNNFNLSRLERYLAVAWDSGATPVIVLTKSDVCEDLQTHLALVENIAGFCDIVQTSMYDPASYRQLEKYLTPGNTAAFIGSSGVGKSTLMNQILGADQLATQEIGRGDKGKHTTTGREIFPCPSGGVVMDTPGMRELGAESVDLSKSFDDIEALTAQCKFGNCSHTSEPGCALQKALLDGQLDPRRWENYQKLKQEAGYHGLNSKEIEMKKLDRMFKEVGGMKNARKFFKEKNKRR